MTDATDDLPPDADDFDADDLDHAAEDPDHEPEILDPQPIEVVVDDDAPDGGPDEPEA